MGGAGPIPMYVLRAENHMEPANTPIAIKGDNVLIELPLEADLEALADRFHIRRRLNLIDWSKTGFSFSF